ncbi:hypothetical protein ABTF26_21800, partial [Acinetobacter baumannii]
GVIKKVVPGAFCAYEFRLRAVGDNSSITSGQRLLWSTIFPLKSDADLPAEGYLHLPQKQKFTAFQFLEGKTVKIENAT